MPPSLRVRLSLLMFAQYGLMGLWAVTLATFLKASPHEGGLNFAARHVGLVYATLALAATVSPLVVGLIADRFFATQRVLAVLHLVGGVVLLFAFCTSDAYRDDVALAFQKAAYVTPVDGETGELWRLLWERESLQTYLADPNRYPPPPTTVEYWYARYAPKIGLRVPNRVTTFHGNTWGSADAGRKRLAELDARLPAAIQAARTAPGVVAASESAVWPMVVLMFVYNLCYVPTVTLSSALAFRNLPDPPGQFGQVRVFGTLGWVAAGWTVGGMLPSVSAVPLALAGLGSVAMAGLCLTQPHTPPATTPRTLADALGLPALRLLTDRSFLAFTLTSLAGSFLMSFHNLFTHPYLVDLGIPHAAAWQTLGQSTEVVSMLLIPRLCAKFGTKAVLCAGVVASGCRFLGYAAGVPWVMLAVGLPLHGVGFALFYITAAIYVDTRAPQDLRASAQGLVTLMTSGGGALLGNWFAGRVVDGMSAGGTVSWPVVWLVPAVGSFVVAAAFAATFRNPPPTLRKPLGPPAELAEPPA